MNRPIRFHELEKLSTAEKAALFKRTESDLGQYIEAVAPIVEAVKERGDQALVEFARQFDKAELDPDAFRVAPSDVDAAFASLDAHVIDAIRFAAESIRIFHEKQMPESMRMTEVRPGVFCGEKTMPIPSVACYVPRGKGAFPGPSSAQTGSLILQGVRRLYSLSWEHLLP